MKFFLSSKIHKAIVTQADLNYIWSITIDKKLCDLVWLEEWEKVLVVSNSSWARLETYIIFWKENSWIICMNWAAAHLIKKWEEIIIMGFSLSQTPIKAKQILVNKNNKFQNFL
jgi:aspartate 1-decarboxylase